jgi:hypothetical protein
MANIRLRVLPRLLPRDGREVEFQATATHIQWRYVEDFSGEYAWQDLIALAELVGPEGPAIELRSDGTNIQYRVVGGGDDDWVDVLPLADITGPQGDTGPQGPAGPGVSDGDKGDVVVSGSGADWAVKGLPSVDLVRFGLVGDGTDETALFEAALAEAWSTGCNKIVCSDPTRRFKVIRAEIADDIEIDLGGAALVADFKGALVPNNSATILKAPGGYAKGSITFTGAGANGSTFTVGDVVYTLTTAGDPASQNEFWRGNGAQSTPESAAFALASAINGERMEVVSFQTGTGTFVEGETLTGSGTGSTGVIRRACYATATTGVLFVFRHSADYSAIETVTGGTSGATGVTIGVSRNLTVSTQRPNLKVRAREDAGVVSLVAIKEGTAGNSIALAESSTSTTVSGAFLTGGIEPIRLTLRNCKIDGQNDGGASTGSGEPLLYFIGGERVVLDNVEVVNGSNRGTGPLTKQRLLDYQTAECIIDGPRLVQIFGGKQWSGAGDQLQIQSWDGSTIYQIIGTVFDKTRSHNPLQNYSNSSINAKNCHPASFIKGAQFFNHVKSAANIFHQGGSLEDILIDGVYDSNGIDFNEATLYRFDGARLKNITLRKITGVGIRTSGSNVQIDGVDEENCTNAIRFEGSLSNSSLWPDTWLDISVNAEKSCSVSRVTSRGAGGFLSYDTQTAAFTLGAVLTGGTSGATARILNVYDSSTTGVLLVSLPTGTFLNDEPITDTAGGAALVNGSVSTNNAVIDVRGGSSAFPVQLRVDGMLDALTPGFERHNYGVDAGNCDLTLTGHLEVGDVALVRQDGYARLTSRATFKVDTDGGARHVILQDGSTIDNITLDDYKRFGSLSGGASDVRFLAAPALAGAIHVNRAVTTPVVSDATKPVVRDGFLRGSVAANPPGVTDAATSTTNVPVVGATAGDVATASFTGNLQGAVMDAVAVAGGVDVTFSSRTATAVNPDSGTLYVYVKPK